MPRSEGFGLELRGWRYAAGRAEVVPSPSVLLLQKPLCQGGQLEVVCRGVEKLRWVGYHRVAASQ